MNYNLVSVDFDPFEEVNLIEKIVPTSESQKEIWLSCILGGDEANLAYNESISLDLEGVFNVDIFIESIQEVLSRHEALRSSISADGEALIIYQPSPLEIIVEDISRVGNQKDELKKFITKVMQGKFDLEKGPLFRTYLHKFNDNRHYFTVVMHHIIADGWSIGVLLEDLSKIYNATTKGLPSLLNKAPQISEYIEEMLDFEKSAEYQETLAYWLNMYRKDVPVLDLPTDYPRPNKRTYTSKRIDQSLSLELIEELKTIGAKSSCSLVNTLLATFEIFLHKQSNQNDITVGLPAAGQMATEKLELVGHCVNLLPLRTYIDSEQSYLDYLKKRKIDLFDAYDHQKFTFGQLVKQLNIKRDSTRIPLLPVMFNIDMGMDSSVRFDNLDHKLISNPRASEAFEIFLNITGSESSLTLEWSYNTQLFKSETIEKMAIDFESLLKEIAKKPTSPIKELTELDANSWNAKLNKWNDTTFQYEKDTILTKFIDLNALILGDKVAISFNQTKITYFQLISLANQFANYLLSKGVKTGDIIGLATDRSIEMVIALLGIMKTGAVYLPLDPEFPQERIEYMLKDSAASILLVSKSYHGKFKSQATELVIEDLWPQLANLKDKDPQINVKGTDLAYILYTSGSTGKPKGVKIGHQSLINFLISMQQNPGIKETDKLLAITTISFDIAGLELFLPLISGAEFILCDTESARDGRILLELIEKENITIMQATPSTWRMMIDSGWVQPYKKLKVLSGGEALTKELADQLIDLSAEVWNLYGPTETTIWSTVKLISKDDKQLSIGRPINNTQVYLLDENNRLVQPGTIGEICIGGDGLGYGYLGLPQLTNERFINYSVNKIAGTKIYKTGDLGQFTEDGEIICLGRIDQQVKIRGHRIELGEIEALLNAQTEIKQSVISTSEDNPGDVKLIAYIILDNTNNIHFDKDNLNDFSEIKANWESSLRKTLPDYMVPYDFIIIDYFPLTPNNKIDKKALPKSKKKTRTKYSGYTIQNRNEKIITEIWSSVLNIENIDINDDFFELGGHSLLAIKIMTAIEKTFGKRLPLSAIFESSTIEKLAREISSEEENQWKSLVPIKESGHKPPLYIVHGQGMHVLAFYTLSNSVDKNQPLYGLQPKGLNPDDSPIEDIEEVAAGYVKEIIEHNPTGPYAIAGYSSGGTIALEMSEQLLKMGKKVSLLALIDTYNDGDSYLTLIKENKWKDVFDHGLKFVGYGFIYFFRYPRAFIRHKFNFISGTLYNNYKKINPIKKDPSNPLYILDRLQKTHERGFSKYKLKNYNSDVTLFRGNDKKMTYIPNLESNGWAPFINGKLTFIDVPLEHLQFFDPNYVDSFAKELQKELNKIS